MANQKIDLFKLHKAEYVAPKEPVILDIKRALFLTIDGMGEPGGGEFTKRVGALYAVAYGIKMAKKRAGQDYTISKLEALWWGIRGPGDFSEEPMSDWNWKLMIRVPEFVTELDLKDAISDCLEKGKALEVAKVRLENIHEGLSVQVLHVGPYSKVSDTMARMSEFVKRKGLSFHGLHHEIYLSDPRRMSPDRLRTILRMPVVE
jgi:hypothetical protein